MAAAAALSGMYWLANPYLAFFGESVFLFIGKSVFLFIGKSEFYLFVSLFLFMRSIHDKLGISVGEHNIPI